jgi:uncharacterized protein (TIGR04255 family)
MPETPVSKFHFPADITLQERPLVEAWLELRWELEFTGPPQLASDPMHPFRKDPFFPFALGTFYNQIKDRFGYKQDLPAAIAPDDALPYVVRHQFRVAEGEWPVLQLGPGVATVNFTHPYTWKIFEEEALYLRTQLIEAYSDTELVPNAAYLRYRNAIPCQYSSSNPLEFLRENLNTSISLPEHIPGRVSLSEFPSGVNISLNFKLTEPVATATLYIATGTKKTADDQEEEQIIFELRVASSEKDAPSFIDEREFSNWLNAAHAVIHEWFFSLIKGSLREAFESGG